VTAPKGASARGEETAGWAIESKRTAESAGSDRRVLQRPEEQHQRRITAWSLTTTRAQ